MFKLLSLLAAGLFLTLLIGGEDRGQMRQGLIGAAPTLAERPVVRPVLAQTKAEPKPDVMQTGLVPVEMQAPAAKPAIAGNSEVEKVATAAETAPETASALPIMYVSSRSVNVRQGPSTDYEVIGRLSRAEAVTVVTPEEDGWVRISIEGDGLEGFVAARLLSDTAPSGN